MRFRAEMAEDLVKLTHFRRDLENKDKTPANYYEAYFWLYGIHIDEWAKVNSQIKDAAKGKDIDCSLIKCFSP